MTSHIWQRRRQPAGLTGRAMLYNTLLPLIVFMFCLSLFLVHRVSVLEGDIRSLQRDIILQLNQPRSDRVNGKMDRMSQTREVCHWLCRIKSSWTCTTEIYAIIGHLDTCWNNIFSLKACFLWGHKAECFSNSSQFSEDISEESKKGAERRRRWVEAESEKCVH